MSARCEREQIGAQIERRRKVSAHARGGGTRLELSCSCLAKARTDVF